MIFNTNKEAGKYYMDICELKERKDFMRNMFNHKIIKDDECNLIDYFVYMEIDLVFVSININFKLLCANTLADVIVQIIYYLIIAKNRSKIKELYNILCIDTEYFEKIYIILEKVMTRMFKIGFRHKLVQYFEMLFDIIDFGTTSLKNLHEIASICHVMMLYIVINGNQRKIYLYTKRLERIGFTWKYFENDRKLPEYHDEIDIILIRK